MTVCSGFLPKCVNVGFTGFFHDLRKPRCFNFEQLHWWDATTAYPPWRGRAGTARKSPPENYGKEDQATVAAFLPWRGSQVLNP